MAGGRPSNYKPEFCEQIIKFCTKDLTEINTEGKVVATQLPTLKMFAISVGVTGETLIEWAKEKPQFSESYSKAKELCENHLIQNALQGRYKENFAKFVAMNYSNMKDKSETDITSKGQSISMPTITVDSKDLEFNVGEKVDE